VAQKDMTPKPVLAWEAGTIAGWEDMDDYDPYATSGFRISPSP
jgi:hypothetical protein